ncbi:hypothetical protein GO013_12925 [Pseudodesulfovibrio sp. JC047]|uniref:hypothetical protein n=1 Tax=Pseudodesulfovibrio sp. JC047 TaxID=2683199 RepID=UPI0013D832B0|nr:hypothetical protein [Pseudodesulfovibrio sp. JC047]NDV20312.1 hypothetical protein [Pseudodesulfovibrio sp. JC047]
MEKLTFGPNTLTEKTHPHAKNLQSFSSQYTLLARGSQLLMKTQKGVVVLVDFSTDEWTVPVFCLGDISITSPLALCRIVEEKTALLFGHERTVLTVQSRLPSPIPGILPQTWTVVSGLGLVTKGDFKLVKINTPSGAP